MLKQDFGVEKISMINISASISLLATTASKIRLYFVYNTILTQCHGHDLIATQEGQTCIY